MSPRFPLIIFFGALSLLNMSAPIRADETVLGRIHDQDGDRVRACFYDGFRPARGEEFDAFRNVAVSAPKDETRIRRAYAGVIRIETTAGDGCAVATKVSGGIQNFDWLAAHGKR